MSINFIIKLALIMLLSVPSFSMADTDEKVYVDVKDPKVVSVANFAAQKIQRGNLYKVISAKKQGDEDITYIVKIEVVDAHFKHHLYIVEVLVPEDESPWKIKFFAPMAK